MRHRVLGLFLCILIVVTPALAQGPARGIARRQAVGMARVLRQLNLTPDQRVQVRALLQQQRQQVQAVRQDPSLTAAQRQAKIKNLRQATQQQFQGLLTPDQQQHLAQIRQRAHPLRALDLTPDQRAQLQPILRQQRAQVQAIRRDQDLTPRQKREKVQAIRQSTEAQVRSLLTPEQQQRFDELRQSVRPAPAPTPNANPEGF